MTIRESANLEQAERWADDVAGRTVRAVDALDAVERFVKRFIAFPNKHHATVVVLFSGHTYLVERVSVTLYLHVTSAEPESGKSQLLDVLVLVVRNPWLAVQPSEATLFRKIDADHPTLLLDEIDPIFRVKSGGDPTAEGLRAILNAGYQRGRPVPRCVGQGSKMQVTDFDVYGAKALAGLGEVPATIASRSVRIEMKRRAPCEVVEPLFVDEVRDEAASIAGGLQKLAEQTPLTNLREIRRELLDLGLGDRMSDGWSSLIALADATGGEWPRKARDAAKALSGRDARSNQETIRVHLLADLKALFDERHADRIATTDLLAAICADDERPWGAWSKGEAMTARALATMVRPLAIGPKKSKGFRGYTRESFEDAFDRYLPPSNRQPAPDSIATGSFANCEPPPGADAESAKGPATVGEGAGGRFEGKSEEEFEL